MSLVEEQRWFDTEVIGGVARVHSINVYYHPSFVEKLKAENAKLRKRAEKARRHAIRKRYSDHYRDSGDPLHTPLKYWLAYKRENAIVHHELRLSHLREKVSLP